MFSGFRFLKGLLLKECELALLLRLRLGGYFLFDFDLCDLFEFVEVDAHSMF